MPSATDVAAQAISGLGWIGNLRAEWSIDKELEQITNCKLEQNQVKPTKCAAGQGKPGDEDDEDLVDDNEDFDDNGDDDDDDGDDEDDDDDD